MGMDIDQFAVLYFGLICVPPRNGVDVDIHGFENHVRYWNVHGNNEILKDIAFRLGLNTDNPCLELELGRLFRIQTVDHAPQPMVATPSPSVAVAANSTPSRQCPKLRTNIETVHWLLAHLASPRGTMANILPAERSHSITTASRHLLDVMVREEFDVDLTVVTEMRAANLIVSELGEGYLLYVTQPMYPIVERLAGFFGVDGCDRTQLPKECVCFVEHYNPSDAFPEGRVTMKTMRGECDCFDQPIRVVACRLDEFVGLMKILRGLGGGQWAHMSPMKFAVVVLGLIYVPVLRGQSSRLSYSPGGLGVDGHVDVINQIARRFSLNMPDPLATLNRLILSLEREDAKTSPDHTPMACADTATHVVPVSATPVPVAVDTPAPPSETRITLSVPVQRTFGPTLYVREREQRTQSEVAAKRKPLLKGADLHVLYLVHKRRVETTIDALEESHALDARLSALMEEAAEHAYDTISIDMCGTVYAHAYSAISGSCKRLDLYSIWNRPSLHHVLITSDLKSFGRMLRASDQQPLELGYPIAAPRLFADLI